MELSADGIALIKKFEAFRPTAYKPTKNDVWTCGYGHTRGVTEQTICTTEQAEAWLQQDVAGAANDVNNAVKVSINQHQFDALVSLTFNIGVGAFNGSTLLRKLNATDVQGAADQFAVWNKQGGRVLPGLVTRRAAEAALFLRT